METTPLGKNPCFICSHGSDVTADSSQEMSTSSRLQLSSPLLHHHLTPSQKKKTQNPALPPWSPVGHEFLLQRKEENSNVGCQECQKDLLLLCVPWVRCFIFPLILLTFLFRFTKKNIGEGLSQYLKYFAAWMLLRLVARLDWKLRTGSTGSSAPCH